MITVIEGVDGSGKTTLCNKLVEKYGFIRVDVPPRMDNKKEEYEEWRKWCDRYCNYNREVVGYICDRSIISELVYRMQDYEETFMNERLFIKFLHGLQVVYCNSSTSYNDAMNRGDDNIKNQAQHICRFTLYNGFMYLLQEVYRVPICIYDWHDKKDFNKVVKFIKRSIL